MSCHSDAAMRLSGPAIGCCTLLLLFLTLFSITILTLCSACQHVLHSLQGVVIQSPCNRQ